MESGQPVRTFQMGEESFPTKQAKTPSLLSSAPSWVQRLPGFSSLLKVETKKPFQKSQMRILSVFSENWKEKTLANLFRKFRFPEQESLIIEEKELYIHSQD